MNDMGGIPKSLRLLKYNCRDSRYPDDLLHLQLSDEIQESPKTINLGFASHVFEIEADGIHYRVRIEGKKAIAIRL